MNIEEQWKNLEGSRDKDLSGMLNMPSIKNFQSKDPLVRLKWSVFGNTVWGVLITIGYIAVTFFFPYWQLILCVAAIVLFNSWMMAENLRLYRKITEPAKGKSMLEEMERHYNSLYKWIRLQEKAFLFIYPVIIIGAGMVGAVIGTEKQLGEVILQPKMIKLTLILLAIGLPLCYFLGKRLNHLAFGQYIKQLKNNIRALKEEKG